MSDFDIGNVYSKLDPASKKRTYYLAVDKLKLVTRMDEKFATFSTKKNDHAHENGLSVKKLCRLWNIGVKDLDEYMSQFFMPDEDALMRARRDKFAAEEERELGLGNELDD